MRALTAPRPVVTAVSLALAVGVLTPFLTTVDAQQPALILATAAVLAAPIAIRVVRGEFDPFEPIVIFVAVWGLMFVGRPLVMRATGDTWLRGQYDVEAGITPALVVGLISAAAFLVGYWAGRRRAETPARSVRRGPPPAWTAAVPAVMGFGVMVFLAGNTFNEAAAGGAGAYQYLAPLLTIPAILLLLHRGSAKLAYLLLAVSAVGFVGLGQRAFVIWPVSAAVIHWFLANRRRPNVAIIAAICVFGFLPLFTVLEVAREEKLTPLEALSEPTARDAGAAIERFTQGDTTAMFSALALQMMSEGSTWEQRPGYWIYSTTTRWVPSRLWPDKPLGSGEYLYALYFPQSYKLLKAPTAFTLASEFYFDLGFAGVILGMAGMGWLCGRVWLWASSRWDDPWTWTLYAPVFGLATIMVRGDVGLALGLGLFVFAPLFLARFFAKPEARI